MTHGCVIAFKCIVSIQLQKFATDEKLAQGILLLWKNANVYFSLVGGISHQLRKACDSATAGKPRLFKK